MLLPLFLLSLSLRSCSRYCCGCCAVFAVAAAVAAAVLCAVSVVIFDVVATVVVTGGLRKLRDDPSGGGVPDGARSGTGFLRPGKRSRKGRLCREKGVMSVVGGWEL